MLKEKRIATLTLMAIASIVLAGMYQNLFSMNSTKNDCDPFAALYQELSRANYFEKTSVAKIFMHIYTKCGIDRQTSKALLKFNITKKMELCRFLKNYKLNKQQYLNIITQKNASFLHTAFYRIKSGHYKMKDIVIVKVLEVWALSEISELNLRNQKKIKTFLSDYSGQNFLHLILQHKRTTKQSITFTLSKDFIHSFLEELDKVSSLLIQNTYPKLAYQYQEVVQIDYLLRQLYQNPSFTIDRVLKKTYKKFGYKQKQVVSEEINDLSGLLDTIKYKPGFKTDRTAYVLLEIINLLENLHNTVNDLYNFNKKILLIAEKTSRFLFNPIRHSAHTMEFLYALMLMHYDFTDNIEDEMGLNCTHQDSIRRSIVETIFEAAEEAFKVKASRQDSPVAPLPQRSTPSALSETILPAKLFETPQKSQRRKRKKPKGIELPSDNPRPVMENLSETPTIQTQILGKRSRLKKISQKEPPQKRRKMKREESTMLFDAATMPPFPFASALPYALDSTPSPFQAAGNIAALGLISSLKTD